MKMHPMKGISLTLAIGKWAKPHFKAENYTTRLCLGFIAVTFYTLDIEEFIKHLIDKSKSTTTSKGEQPNSGAKQ